LTKKKGAPTICGLGRGLSTGKAISRNEEPETYLWKREGATLVQKKEKKQNPHFLGIRGLHLREGEAQTVLRVL